MSEDLKYPEGLGYTKEHEWVKKEGDMVIIGITDFAQHQLTDVVFVEIPEKGKKVKANDNLCSIESVKSVSDIFAPVSGEVVDVNSEIEDSPELINSDPYGKGWIAKIKFDDEAEVDGLMSPEEYKNSVSE